jgi:hypothetical protein
MKKFETKDYINYALSFAGIAVTVALIAKPEKIEIIKNEYFVPSTGLTSYITDKIESVKESVTTPVKEEPKVAVTGETKVEPKVAPVVPVKEEVKKEPVKEVVQEVKEEPVQEVKENPFEVVKWTFDFGMERVENLYIKEWNVKVYAQAYHRQGTLATVNKCQYYTRADGKTKNSAEAEVTKEMGNDYISFRAYADQDLRVRTFVKCYAFTNNGGDITYGESDWIEVK